MKKLILFMAVIACVLSAKAQDVLYIYNTDGTVFPYTIASVDSMSFTKPTNTTDSGVVINGVKWATRNVATPATFAFNPEEAGMFYQWNSKIGWPSTGTVTGWISSWNGGYTTASATDTWTSANDPSPSGWRVPTLAEIKTLTASSKVTSRWTTQNSVYGEKFTDKTTGNSIFLPASGYRADDGTLRAEGSYGYYWSSTAYDVSNVYYLSFDMMMGPQDATYGRAFGLPVRPVAK
jgi:uncharacterized protein (TIGR02145 family)